MMIMMTTNKMTVLLLFFCLSNLTIHTMDKLTHTLNALYKDTTPKLPKSKYLEQKNVPAHNTPNNQRSHERKKAVQLRKARELKLNQHSGND